MLGAGKYACKIDGIGSHRRVFGLDRRVREIECATSDGEEEEEDEEFCGRTGWTREMGLKKKIKKKKQKTGTRKDDQYEKVLSIPRTMKRDAATEGRSRQ